MTDNVLGESIQEMVQGSVTSIEVEHYKNHGWVKLKEAEAGAKTADLARR